MTSLGDKKTSVFPHGHIDRSGWKCVMLGDVCSIVMGQSPDSSGYNTKGEGLPLIQGNADISDRQTIRRTYSRSITKSASSGDIILTVRAPVGNVARATFDCCLGRGVCALKNAPSYLFYQLEFIEPTWGRFSGGSTFDSINSDALASTPIMLPDRDCQNKITASISSIDTHISALKSLIAKYEAIKKATVNLLLKPKTGWRIVRLSEIMSLSDGDWIESKDQSSSGIRLVQTGNIGEGDFIWHNERARFISKETFKRLHCTEVFPGDCLISRLPDPIGRACVIPASNIRMITAVDCAVARPIDNNIDIRYFVYFTSTSEYRSQMDVYLMGSTRQRVSRANLGKTLIALPPLDEQKRIVAILDSIDVTICGLKSQLAKACDIKQGMMHCFFG